MPQSKRDAELGASAVEYSLLVVAIAAIIVLIVFAVGEFTGQAFMTTCDSLDSGYSMASPPTC